MDSHWNIWEAKKGEKKCQIRYAKILNEFGRQEIIGYLGKSNYWWGGKKNRCEMWEQRKQM